LDIDEHLNLAPFGAASFPEFVDFAPPLLGGEDEEAMAAAELEQMSRAIAIGLPRGGVILKRAVAEGGLVVGVSDHADDSCRKAWI